MRIRITIRVVIVSIFLSTLVSTGIQAKLVKAPPFNLLNEINGPSVSDFTPHGTQPGISFSMASADNCNDCHAGFTTDDQKFTPSMTWSGSMMANSGRDPLFWAAVDIANQDVPGVGDYCIRCHSPVGFYKGHTKNGAGNLDYANGCKLSGSLTSFDNENNDYQGVNCHFCHRVDQNGPNGEAQIIQNSDVWLDDESCNNPDGNNNFGPCRKGPYNPPLQDFHAWEFSTFIQSSEFCGSCHNVTTPDVLTDGVISPAELLWDGGVQTNIPMPIERTYSEWLNSDFADVIYADGFGGDVITEFPLVTKSESCQDCHMPESFDPAARACIQTTPGSRTGDMKTHEFAGGNSWMPAVLKTIYGDALSEGQLIDRNAAYDRTISYALDMLQNKSALIETSLVSATATDAEVKVKVTNLTGHKLPTGYLEGRRMWINLVVRDNSDTIIYESGGYDLTTAVLSEDPALKVYESNQGIWDDKLGQCVTESNGIKQFHFVQNNCVAKDNRIPPLGFRGATNIEMKSVGIIYPVDPNNPSAVVNYDETNYAFSIPDTAVMPLSVTATLKYQTSSKDYIEFLESESTTASENALCDRSLTVGPADQSRGAYMKQLWEDNGKSAPVDMTFSAIKITP